jgi:hypothetical protein
VIPARIRHVAGSYAEKIAVLELQSVFPAQRFQLRMEPLLAEEPVVSLAYPGDRLRVAGDRFVRYGDSGRLAGTALLEMYDGNDRLLVLDHGASGAPVVDCAGRVVAVVSNLLTTTMQLMSRAIRISTAWGISNVISVPIPALKDFSSPQRRLKLLHACRQIRNKPYPVGRVLAFENPDCLVRP